jgi:hypothetical protein
MPECNNSKRGKKKERKETASEQEYANKRSNKGREKSL